MWGIPVAQIIAKRFDTLINERNMRIWVQPDVLGLFSDNVGSYANGMKLSPKQSRNREVVEL
jgi:hypothetical protein